jgi:hypothetical protein
MLPTSKNCGFTQSVNVSLGFRPLYCECPRSDTEWLLSTLFDASLLSLGAAGNGGSLLEWRAQSLIVGL